MATVIGLGRPFSSGFNFLNYIADISSGCVNSSRYVYSEAAN